MSTTTDDYLVQEICKTQAEIIKTLEEMKDEVESINAQYIANSPTRIGAEGADLFVMLHETLGELHKALGMWRLVTMIFSITGEHRDE